MKDLNLDDVEYEPTEEELEKYRMILDVQQQELNLTQQAYSSSVEKTKVALNCIDVLTRLISVTTVNFSPVLQGAIDKQLTKFVKALTIEEKGEVEK